MDIQDFIKTSTTLTTNDKYIINTLSVIAMKARENPVLSKDIAKVAINNILKAQPSLKLPCFYVVDSIIKNVGDPYKELFKEKIIDAFINTFQSNKDQRIRLKLYNLRLTWKDHYSSDFMNDLDERVKRFDPAWPLVTKFDPKTKGAEVKKSDNTDNSSAKSSPDSTTPIVTREPHIQKLLPEIKKERKRKNVEVKEEDSLFTIDRLGDNHIKKVVNKKGRLDEKTLACDSLSDGLFGTKDIDLRKTDDNIIRGKQWTSEDVFRLLKKKLQLNEPIGLQFDKPPPMFPVMPPGPPIQPPLPAPREPTWQIPIDGFPQFPHIGTDPRLLSRCPFADPLRTITIDGRKYLLYLDRIQPCIFVNNELHAVRFFCHELLELRIDNCSFIMAINGLTRVKINCRCFVACLGGPGHELILNGWPHNVRIDGSIHQIMVDGLTVNVQFIVHRPVQVNVQRAIPPYVCEWAVKEYFGLPQYLHMPPSNPLRNPKLQDQQANIFRAELNLICHQPQVMLKPPMAPANIDVHDLFQKLVENGIILPNKVSDLKLDITKYNCDLFKTYNDKEIGELYSGHPCDLCGLRFKDKDSVEFTLHSDYHLYKNMAILTSSRLSRDYVGGSRQWILGGAVRVTGTDFAPDAAEVEMDCEEKLCCPAFDDVELNKCAVCKQSFEVHWDATDERHVLLNGISHNDKVYHVLCFQNVGIHIEESDVKSVKNEEEEALTKLEEWVTIPENMDEGQEPDITLVLVSADVAQPRLEAHVSTSQPSPPSSSSSSSDTPDALDASDYPHTPSTHDAIHALDIPDSPHTSRDVPDTHARESPDTNDSPHTLESIDSTLSPEANNLPCTPESHDVNHSPHTPESIDSTLSPEANPSPHTPESHDSIHSRDANHSTHTSESIDSPLTPEANRSQHTSESNDSTLSPEANHSPHTPESHDSNHTHNTNHSPHTPESCDSSSIHDAPNSSDTLDPIQTRHSPHTSGTQEFSYESVNTS